MAAAAIILAGCDNENISDIPESQTSDLISAEIIDDGIRTRTSLEGVRMVWSEGDALCATTADPGSTSIETHRFDISEGAGTASATFKGAEKLSGTYWTAAYPYNICSVRAGQKYIYISYPSVQEYVENGISDGIVPLYATGKDPGALKFAYGSGILRLNLYDAKSKVPVKISKIEVITNIPPCGDFVATPGQSRFPFAHNGANKQTTVTYNVPDVQLSGSSASPTAFNICLAAATKNSDRKMAYSSMEIKIYATNGAVLSKTKTDFEVAGGKIYNFAPLQFDGTISYKVGDYYPDPNAQNINDIEGIVFSVNEDGAHGKILNLTERSGLKWSSNGAQDSTLDEKDGETNWNTIKKKDASFSNYPAFAWCASLGDGWYIPAINELIELRSAWGSTNADKAAFNKRISDIGGEPIKATVTVNGSAKAAYYYSSTEKESAVNKAFSLSFNSTSGASDGIKKSSDGAANLIFRAIKKF